MSQTQSSRCFEWMGSRLMSSLYLALKSKADIKRIPVVLETNTSSSVRLFRDGCHGCVDIARIKLNEAAGRYASKELSLLLASDIHANAARAARRW